MTRLTVAVHYRAGDRAPRRDLQLSLYLDLAASELLDAARVPQQVAHRERVDVGARRVVGQRRQPGLP
ncbi:hypothetical protein [Sorangium sp. So ce1078]|uniref:hypothetical protein n=1 Tax=Sorangium sp. So ce1078 TaxID=3133329 RepID=UPI003F5E2B2D